MTSKNGQQFSGKQMYHIDIGYYFITNVICHGEAQIAYCPTGDMLANFFTKPFQGSLFHKFQDALLNIDPEFEVTSMSLEQECIGAQENDCAKLGGILPKTQKFWNLLNSSLLNLSNFSTNSPHSVQ